MIHGFQIMFSLKGDLQTHVQPRNYHRKERRPGARERHAGLRPRLHESEMRDHVTQPGQERSRGQYAASYSLDSAVADFGGRGRESGPQEVVEEQIRSQYQELSTIEAIRKSMESTARPKTAPPERVPGWMLDLDINLDISAIDTIPPFEQNENTDPGLSTNSFCGQATLVYLDNDSDLDFEDSEINNEIAVKSKQNYSDDAQTDKARPRDHGQEVLVNSNRAISPRTLQLNTFRVTEMISPKSGGR